MENLYYADNKNDNVLYRVDIFSTTNLYARNLLSAFFYGGSLNKIFDCFDILGYTATIGDCDYDVGDFFEDYRCFLVTPILEKPQDCFLNFEAIKKELNDSGGKEANLKKIMSEFSDIKKQILCYELVGDVYNLFDEFENKNGMLGINHTRLTGLASEIRNFLNPNYCLINLSP